MNFARKKTNHIQVTQVVLFISDNYQKLIMPLLTFGTLVLGSAMVAPSNAHGSSNAYDISQYQGNISQNQANHLRHEVNFVVLRTQGGDYKDPQIDHNEQVMDRAHVPYGVYSYSYYTNPYNATLEAKELYNRSPYANFYANDIEQNSTPNKYQLNIATQNWANEMHRLTPKPVVIYSGLNFMNNNIWPSTRAKYNATWLAEYGAEPDPSYHYDLWQNSDNTYSPALHEGLDSDVFPQGYNKPLSFWTGHNVRRAHHYHIYYRRPRYRRHYTRRIRRHIPRFWDRYDRYYHYRGIYAMRVKYPRIKLFYTTYSGKHTYIYAPKGAKIRVTGFSKMIFHHHMITKAHGIFDNTYVVFTSSKHCVKAYY